MTKLQSITYSQLAVTGYLLIITIGTALLSLPAANRDGVSPGFTAALLTATSATCVTGLVVKDTFTQWTVFGQLVILSLIQIGGLGFMTVITMFSIFLKRRIGLKERGFLQDSISTPQIGGVVLLIKKVLIRTLFIETLGALILAIRFIPQMGVKEGLYNGFFHAISAFCNAGFDIMGKYGQYSSLTTYSADAIVCATIALLIIIGGLGFFVWDDMWKNRFQFKRYQLHTKIVLSTTALLIFFGAVLFYLFENCNVLIGKPLGEKVLISFFHSVTPRTAGFNSVNMGVMTPAAKLMTIILMFIGGSPGSTAGGIKTTTLTVIFLSVWSNLHNIKGESIYRRQLEENALRKANTVVVINLTLMLVGSVVIGISNTNLQVGDILFETTSAIATVGLTTGITGSLSHISRLVVSFLMYCGRVGSVSFALFFTEHGAPANIHKPTEKINIG